MQVILFKSGMNVSLASSADGPAETYFRPGECVGGSLVPNEAAGKVDIHFEDGTVGLDLPADQVEMVSVDPDNAGRYDLGG